MTRDDLFTAFGDVKSDYLLAAKASMTPKTLTLRSHLRFAAIAATFAIIVLLIPIVVILANRTAQPPIPPIPSTSTSTTPSTTPKEHLSITDIPGAIRVDTELLDYQTAPTTTKWTVEGFIQKLHKDYFAFLGTASIYNSVFIPDPENNRYLHLTVFEIEVSENVYKADTLKTVKIAYECWYYPTDTGYRLDYNNVVMDLGVKAKKEPYGLYIIDEADHYSINCNNTLLDLSDYADYFLILHCSYDGEYVSYSDEFKGIENLWFKEKIEKFRSDDMN